MNFLFDKASAGGQQDYSNYHDICTRCSGLGFISIYRHIANGRCFRCNGSGKGGHQTLNSPIHRSSRRWYIGFYDFGEGPEVVFSFSSENPNMAKTRVKEELVRIGIQSDLACGKFTLVLGDVGKRKAEVIEEFHSARKIKANTSLVKSLLC